MNVLRMVHAGCVQQEERSACLAHDKESCWRAKNCMVTNILFEYFLLLVLHCTNGHRTGSHGMFGSDVSWAVQVPPLILP